MIARYVGDDLLLQWLSVAQASSRREAVKRLVDETAAYFPGAAVQAVMGAASPRQLYDGKLGWLGRESEAFQRYDARWQPATTSAGLQQIADDEHWLVFWAPGTSTASGTKSAVSPSAAIDSIAAIAATTHGAPHGIQPHVRGDAVVLRLLGPELSDSDRLQLNRWTGPVAEVLWSRPQWSLPNWLRPSLSRVSWLVAAGTATTAIALFPSPYRIHATVRIEPISPRVLSAPFESVIESVNVAPGDAVTEGQTLLTLDGRPLRLEHQSLEAEIHQAAKQKDVALAGGRIADAQQAQLKLQQLIRRRDLLDRRLEQLNVVSPIEGVLVSGDLRRSIGASMELGRTLMEVAPLDRVMVEVAIPEYEVSLLPELPMARIRVDAAGVPTIERQLEAIYPAGELREDQVVFLSLTELENGGRQFRPGMTGKAVVYGPTRPLIWPYVRRAVDQVTWLIGW